MCIDESVEKKVGLMYTSVLQIEYSFLLSLHLDGRIANDGHRDAHALFVDGHRYVLFLCVMGYNASLRIDGGRAAIGAPQ